MSPQVRRLAAKYEDILIDVGGRDTASQRAALAVADLVVIPFAPTSVDLWTVDTVIALLKEARAFNPDLRASAIPTKAFPRGSANAEAAELLRESPEHWTYFGTPIGTRKAFSNAFGGAIRSRSISRRMPKPSRK